MHDRLVPGHVLAAFAFVFAHGTSAFVIVRLRRDHDPDHVRLPLDLSMGNPYGSAIGIAGLAMIIWLMTSKPF
jgi:cation transporter-like permease